MNVEAANLAPNEAGVQRWIVLLWTLLGIGVAAYGLTFAWQSNTGTVRARLYEIMGLSTAIVMFCICWLIAWSAGRSTANIAMALALTAIHFTSALAVALRALDPSVELFAEIASFLMSGVGAALFIRAAQHFPRQISAHVIATSPTLWGRWRIMRAALTTLLRPAVLWSFAMLIMAMATLLTGVVVELMRLLIIAIGIVYFYINYRAGDPSARRQVLWFLAAAVASAVISLLVVTFSAVVGDGGSESLRTVVGVTLVGLDNLAHLVFISAAVFYVGAISPSLVIRKTMVYGLTTALLLFAFATVEVFLHHQIVHFLHVTDMLASSLIGGAFGLTFHPVKHYFESLLDRFLQRHGKPSAHPGH